MEQSLYFMFLAFIVGLRLLSLLLRLLHFNRLCFALRVVFGSGCVGGVGLVDSWSIKTVGNRACIIIGRSCAMVSLTDELEEDAV